MKNYYEILEVDRNASQEVLEKAYRALAKKYHPDLQQGAMKEQYAEKMKIINEAYEILSDSAKREQYNEKLKNEELQNQGISIEEQERILQENYALKQELNRMGNQQTYHQPQPQPQPEQQMDEGTIINMSRILSQEINAARKQAYYDAYIQDMKSRGYRIRYKKGFKYYLKLLVTIVFTVFLCFLIYQIPFVKQFFQNLYNDNLLFQAIVDVFKDTFSTQF